MPTKSTNSPLNRLPRETGRPLSAQQQKSGPPPLASEILAKLNHPARPRSVAVAALRTAQPSLRHNTLPRPGAVQRMPGPLPMASEILARFHRPAVPRAPMASEAPRVRALPGRGAIQQKPGPPPLASEILATFGGAIAARIPADVGPHRPPASSAQLKPSVMLSGVRVAPPAFLPGLTGTQGIRVQKTAPAAVRGHGVAQLFKVDDVVFSNKGHLESKKIGDKKLYDKVCEDKTFSNKAEDVKDRLTQYLSIYPDEAFTLASLKVYLYDDIFRLKIPIDPKRNWTGQALLTTAPGLKRVLGTGGKKQAFPKNEKIRFYRTMKFADFAEMLGVDPSGRTAVQVVRDLPLEGATIKTRIRDTSKLGNHAGDYKQARSYFGNSNEAQALLEFTFDAAIFFSPDNLALPREGMDDLKAVLAAQFPNRVYQEASAAEGTHGDRPGIKSEERGLYSIGLSTPAMAKFIAIASSIKVLEYHIPGVG